MISCKHASQLISKSLDQRLSFLEGLSLRLHLLICKVCARFGKQLYIMRSAIKELMKQIENDETIQLPLQSKMRIQDLIESNRD